MKRVFLLLVSLTFAFSTFAQDANRVLGVWLTQYGDSKVTVKKDSHGKFYGAISWLREPMRNGKPKLDDKNPKSELRSRPIMGLRILNGFVFDGDEWEDGTIYDPKTGKTYKCLMWFEDSDYGKLHVKGYIGFSLIGKEVIWTRDR